MPQRIVELAPGFLDLLDRWNATHALTALPPDARWEELIQDSCALLPHLTPLASGSRVLDLGTGMGIPAIVLAMARPDLQIHALDKSRKKIAFVRQVVMEIGLDNLFPVVGRAEEVPPLRADLGTAKAVGSPTLLGGWWERHGKPTAPLLLLKGEDWRSEPFPDGWSAEAFPYRLPSRGERVILHLKRKPGP